MDKDKKKKPGYYDTIKAVMANAFKTPGSIMGEAKATGSKKVNKFRSGMGQGKLKKGQ